MLNLRRPLVGLMGRKLHEDKIKSTTLVFKNLGKPIILGLGAGLGVIALNLLIGLLLSGDPLMAIEANGLFAYLIPASVGFQIFLFGFHRASLLHHHSGTGDRIGATGSVTSTFGMVACCLHHVNEVLAPIGVIFLASSLILQYRDLILGVGLALNLAGSYMLLRIIRAERRHYSACNKPPSNSVKDEMSLAETLVS